MLNGGLYGLKAPFTFDDPDLSFSVIRYVAIVLDDKDTVAVVLVVEKHVRIT